MPGDRSQPADATGEITEVRTDEEAEDLLFLGSPTIRVDGVDIRKFTLASLRAQIGIVTSGTRSPILKKTIALARLDVAHAATGTEVEVGKLDGHQKRLPARIVRFPHYDPDKSRVRG